MVERSSLGRSKKEVREKNKEENEEKEENIGKTHWFNVFLNLDFYLLGITEASSALSTGTTQAH
jgi:hypothetical protein